MQHQHDKFGVKHWKTVNNRPLSSVHTDLNEENQECFIKINSLKFGDSKTRERSLVIE